MRRRIEVEEIEYEKDKKKLKKEEVTVDIKYANECETNKLEETKWPRPQLEKKLDPKKDSIVFQQMEGDYTMQIPDFDSEIASQWKRGDRDQVPIIRMFGCTEEGYSVLLLIHGVQPYIYVPVPTAKVPPENIGNDLCNKFRIALNAQMMRILANDARTTSDLVLMVQIEEKCSIMKYHSNLKSPFFKVVFAVPGHVPTARKILEEGLLVNGIGNTPLSYQTFESNIAFVMRFMVDYGISGACWLEIPPGKWNYLPHSLATTQYEIECSYEDLIAYPSDSEEWSKVAPLRILSFDIECAGRPGGFPDPKEDPVIQIANVVSVLGDDKPIIRNIFVLDLCSPIIGADVRCFKTEKELLLAWKDFIIKTDPDILTGYNILNFDIPYLIDRAAKFKIDKEFNCLSRLKDVKIKIKEASFSSTQTGTRESKEVNMYGRVMFDVLQAIQRDYKLSSYTLNSVSAKFLGQQKEDVHYSIISKLHSGSSDDRRRLASYCLKDAFLPLILLNSLMLLINYIEMTRVTGVPFSFLLSRGQGIRVISQLLRKIKPQGIVVPTYTSPPVEQGYEGAYVIQPRIGFYPKPIPTLDFASLYPSIMMAHNLCYSTLLSPAEEEKLTKDDYEVSPTGDKFVKAHIRKGVLPQILEDLLVARAKAKSLMAKETDPMKKKVYNGRQLALKTSANSVYGFTGQAKGALPCVEISASVTGYGREMIKSTQQVIQSEYTVKNGYPADAEVIYGDTDSVMINFGVDTIEEAIKLGTEASKFVSSKFTKPIHLEFEKVYYPWLLMSKKRYAGLWWTKPDKWDKIDAKGLESVRRDNCALVRHVIDKLLKKILIERDVDGSIDFAKNVIRDLLQNKVDLSLLIITKSLTKSQDKYSNPQAHAMLVERMKKRDSATAPQIGDRIPYVIVRGDKEARTWEKAEDPIYVLEHSIAIDAQYYLENQLAKPLCRIFKSLMDNPQATLLAGEHTRQIAIPTPKTGGIVGFTKVRETCLGCRALLTTSEKGLCVHCKDNSPIVYQSFLNKVRVKEREFSRLWTQCQHCQGSLHQEVLCTARDCPIYYLRTKTQKDLDEARQSLSKFDDLSW